MVRRRTVLATLVALVAMAGIALAQTVSQDVVIKVTVPEKQGLSIGISKIVGNEWTPVQEITFSDLRYDDENSIFVCGYYYAVDVGVLANTSDWTLSYSATSIVGPNGYKLDKHINVIFLKQYSDTQSELITKVTYGDALGTMTLSKSDLNGGWLRIYYGLATGDRTVDAPGAEPITTNVPAGEYSGTITLTLTTP